MVREEESIDIFDRFVFFDPRCTDKRYREIMMRTKYCLTCAGMKDCKTHPEFWLGKESAEEKTAKRAAKGKGK